MTRLGTLDKPKPSVLACTQRSVPVLLSQALALTGRDVLKAGCIVAYLAEYASATNLVWPI